VKKTLRIVGKKAESRRIGSGALRREILGILEANLDIDISDLPSWVYKAIDRLEERYTPRQPSIRDQVHFMVALGSLVSVTPPPDAPETVKEAMHYLSDPLGLRFHEVPELKFFTDSPDVGSQTCICSYCEEVIKEEDAPPIRFFDTENNKEARLHSECFKLCKHFDLIPENTQGIQ